MKPVLKFPTQESLVSWLLSDAGRPILELATKGAIEHGIKQDKRLAVLVTHSDGLVELYTKGVHVVTRNMIEGDDMDYSERENYLWATLPRGMRPVYKSKHLAATVRCATVTPESELESVQRHAEFDALKEVFGFPPPKERKPCTTIAKNPASGVQVPRKLPSAAKSSSGSTAKPIAPERIIIAATHRTSR